MKNFVKRLVAGSVIFVLMVNPALAALKNPVSVGSVAANTNAVGLVLDANNHQTELKQAANGTTVVDIAAPTAKGVSQNNFSEFNVDQAGIIFNNSQGPVLTQLGGWSDGNRRLAGGTAKIILTQVTGNNRSKLQGQVEIAGQAADFILANANGISCDGCGFINTPRVSLITGNAQTGADGALGFNVLGGDVSIEGEGLNANNISRFDIITRAAKINAAIYANQLNIITGKNSVDYSSGDIATLADATNNSPILFAIDSSLLGGMYGNNIRLIGTEKGLGVNTQGMVQSITDLEISADGDIQLKNAQANHQLKIQSASGAIDNQGTVYGKNVSITALNDINNHGLMAAEESLNLSGDNFNQLGSVYSGLKANNTLTGIGNVSAKFKGAFNNSSDFFAAGAANLQINQLTNSGAFVLQSEKNITGIAQIKNTGTLQFNAQDSVTFNTQTIDNQNGILSYSGSGTFHLIAAQDINNATGTLSAHGDLNVSANNINNNGGVIAAQAAQLQANNIDNTAGTLETSQLTLNANDLNNQQGVITAISSTPTNLTSSISLTGDLDNQQGVVYFNHANSNLSAQSIHNAAGLLVFANQSATKINALADIDNQSGLIQSGDLTLGALTLDNTTGQIIAANAQLNTQNILNSAGQLQADRWAIQSNNYTSVGGILLSTHKTLGGISLLMNQDFNQSFGAVTQTLSGDLQITANNIDNTDSAIYNLGAGQLNIVSANLVNKNGAISNDGISTIATTEFDNTFGFIAGKNLSVTATGITNNSGVIRNNGTALNVIADAFDNTQGVLTSAGIFNLTIKNNFNNTQGVINSSDLLNLTANDFNNQSGSVVSSTDLNLTTLQNINNDAGQMIATGTLTTTAKQFNNGTGLASAKSLALLSDLIDVALNGTLQAEHLSLTAPKINNDGFIFASGSLSNDLSLNTQSFLNKGTLEAASTDWDLSTLAFINDHGAIVHDGTGELRLGSAASALVFDNSSSVIATQGTLTLNAQSINNTKGTLIAAKNLNVHLIDLNNNFGVLQSGGDFNLTTDYFNNANGSLMLNGNSAASLTITNLLDNQQGTIVYSGQTGLTLTATDINNSTGKIISQSDLVINNLNAIDNNQGLLSAAKQFSLNSETQNNQGEISAKALVLNLQNFNNLNGSVVANLVTGTVNQFNNQQGLLQADVFNFTSQDFDNSNGGQVFSEGAALSTLNTQTWNNNLGSLTVDQLKIITNNINNQQGTITGKNIDLQSVAIDNSNQGKIAALQSFSINATNTLNNQNGTLQSSGSGVNTIDAKIIDNASGKIALLGAGNLNITADQLTHNNLSELYSKNDLQLNIKNNFDNAGSIQAENNLTITAATINNSLATSELLANQITLNATSTTNAGQIEAGSIQLNGSDATNSGVMIASATAGQAMQFNLTGNLLNQGTLENNANNWTLSRVDNQGTIQLIGSGLLNLTAIDNKTNGKIYSNGDIKLSGDLATGIFSNAGLVSAVNNLDIQIATINNQNGSILHAGTGALTLTSAAQLNNAGTISSIVDVILNSAGLNNSGNIVADKNLTLNSSGNITNQLTGVISVNGDLAINKTGVATIDLINAGEISSGGKFYLDLGLGDLTNSGSLVINAISNPWNINSLTNSGTLSHNGTGAFDLTATNITNSGNIYSELGILNFTAASITNNKDIVANQFNAFGVSSFKNTAGAKLSSNQIQINNAQAVAGLFENDGIVEASGATDSLQIYTAQFDNLTNGKITTNSNNQTFHGNFANAGIFTHAGTGILELGKAGTVTTAINSKINSAGIINVLNSIAGSGKIFSDAGIDINTGANTFTNNGTTLYTTQNFTIHSTVDNQANGQLVSDGVMTIDTTGAVTNDGLIQGQALQLTAQTLTNNKNIFSVGGATGNINAQTITNSGNIGSSSNQFSISAANGVINNTATGVISAENALSLSAINNTINNQGSIETNGLLTINDSIKPTHQLINSGFIYGATLDFNLQKINNSFGTINATGSAITSLIATATTADAFDNTNGKIYANSTDLTINSSGTFNNTAGQVNHYGAGTLTFTAQNLTTDSSSKLLSNGGIELKVTSQLNNAGEIAAFGLNHITANNLVNTGIIGSRAGEVKLDLASFTLTNTSGTINGFQKLTIAAQSIANASFLESANDIAITTNGFTQVGNINSNNSLSITLGQGDLTLTATDSIKAPGSLSIILSELGKGFNNSGTISSVNAMTLNGSFLNNYAGAHIDVGNGAGLLNISGDVMNAGTISAKQDLLINASNFINAEAGIVVTGDNLSFDLKNNFTNAGTIFSNKDITIINSQNITNQMYATKSAEIYANGNINFTAENTFKNIASRIEAGGDLTVTAKGSISNQSTTPQVQTVNIGCDSNIMGYILPGGPCYDLLGAHLTPMGQVPPQGYYLDVGYITTLLNPITIAKIYAGSNLTLDGGMTAKVSNDFGEIEAGKDISINGLDFIHQSVTTGQETKRLNLINEGPCSFLGVGNCSGSDEFFIESVTPLTSNLTFIGHIHAGGSIIQNLVNSITISNDPLDKTAGISPTAPITTTGTSASNKTGSDAIGSDEKLVELKSNRHSRDSTTGGSYNGATVKLTDLIAGGSGGQTGAQTGSPTQTINYVSAVDADQLKALAESSALNKLLAQLNGGNLTPEQLLALINQIRSGENPFTTDQVLQDFLTSVNGWFAANLSEADKESLLAQADLTAIAAKAKVQAGNTQAPTLIQIDILPYGFNLDNLSGLFVINNNPNSRYLIETRPEFTQYTTFLGSDYLLDQLGLDPDKTQKRLGDAFFENQLIRDSLMRDLSLRYLDGALNDFAMMQLLMDNAVQENASLHLSIGVELTPEQCAHLTQDILWLVEKTVKGQKVLVPRLYLTSVSKDKLEASTSALAAGGSVELTAKNGITNNTKIVANNLLMSTQGSLEQNGTLIAHGDIRLLADQNIKNIGKISGANINFLAKGDITNTSTISAANVLQVTSTEGSVINASKAMLNSGGTLSVAAKNDIKNQQGTMSGGDVSLYTKNGDIIFEDPAAGIKEKGQTIVGGGALISRQNLTVSAGGNADLQGMALNAENNISLQAGNTLNLQASNINAGKNVTLDAGKDVLLTASGGQNTTVSNKKKNTTTSTTAPYQVSSVTAGNNITVNAGHDLLAEGTKFKANGNLTLAAANDINLTALENKTTTASKSKNKKSSSEIITHELGSLEATNGNIIMDAGHDINVQGTQVNAGKAIALKAANDVNLLAVEDSNTSESSTTASKKRLSGLGGVARTSMGLGGKPGVLSVDKSKITSSDKNSESNFHVVNLNAGTGVSIDAGHDATLQGTQIKAVGDISIAAANDLNFNAVANKKHSESIGKNKRIDDKVTHTLVNIESTGGNVQLNAGNDANLIGTNVTADKNISIHAERDTNISAVVDSTYHYDKTKKKSGGVLTSSSKTTTNETLKETAVGGAISGDNVLINAHVNEEGNVIGDKSGNVNLLGANISAKSNVIISADEDINASGIQTQETDFHQTKKSGSFGLSKRDSGSVEKNTNLTHANIAAKENVILQANNIKLVGTNVTATNGNINMEAVDQLLVSAGEISQTANNWNNKSGVFTGGQIYSKHEHKDGVTKTSTQASNITAGGIVTAKAGAIKIEGSNIAGDKGIGLFADSGDIEITAASTHSEAYTHDKDLTVGLGDVGKNLSRPDKMVKNKNGRASVKFADAQYSDISETTKITGSQASTIESAEGNVVANATAGKINIAGSDVTATNGTIGLVGANGVDITTVTEAMDFEKKSTIGSAEMSVVVQHQAAEVVVAALAVETARKKLEQAKKDYKNYERNLDGLQTQLKTLEADYAAKTPGVNYDDIVELRQLISDTKGDASFYKAGIALAALNVTTSAITLAQQIATAAASTGTYGFNAGVQLDLDATKTKTETHDTFETGSTIAAKNIIIQTGKINVDNKTYDAKGTTTNIHGSKISATDSVVINTGELNVTAGEATHESSTETQHGHITAQVTVYGAAGGASVSGSFDRNKNSERSNTYNNSEITGDKINITTTDNANFHGATVRAESELNMDVGGDLNVESVQNRSSTRSTGFGVSGGMSFSGEASTTDNHKHGVGDVKDASGVNGGINVSNGRSSTKETVLTSLTSGGVANINVKGHTQLTGAEIATTDKDGNDLNNLNFSTGSFNFTDLRNTNYSSNTSVGVSSNFGISGGQKDPTTESTTSTGKTLKASSSNLTFSNSQTNDASKTLATLGHGNITVGGIEIEKNGEATGLGNSDSMLTGLNRDVTKIDKSLWSSSTSQTVDVTLDHRVLSADGRAEIKDQITHLPENLEKVGKDTIVDLKAAELIVQSTIALADKDVSLFGGNNSKSLGAEIQQNLGMLNGTVTTKLQNPDAISKIVNGNATAQEREAGFNQLGQSITSELGADNVDVHMVVQDYNKLDTRKYEGTDIPTQILGGFVPDQTNLKGENPNATNHVFLVDDHLGNTTALTETFAHDLDHNIQFSANSGLKGDVAEMHADRMSARLTDTINFVQSLYGGDALGATNTHNEINLNNSHILENNKNFNSQNMSVMDYRESKLDETNAIELLKKKITNESGLTGAALTKALHDVDATRCAKINCAAQLGSNDSHYDEFNKLQTEGKSLEANGYDLIATLKSYNVPTTYKALENTRAGFFPMATSDQLVEVEHPMFQYGGLDWVNDHAAKYGDSLVFYADQFTTNVMKASGAGLEIDPAAAFGVPGIITNPEKYIENSKRAAPIFEEVSLDIKRPYVSTIGESNLNSWDTTTWQPEKNYIFPVIGVGLEAAPFVKGGVTAVKSGTLFLDETLGISNGFKKVDGVVDGGINFKNILPSSETITLTEKQARNLDGENKGLIYVAESTKGKGNEVAQDFQAGTTGAFSDLTTGKNGVPALRFDNPNSKGVNFIKFDGIESGADGSTVLLIDAKTKLPLWNESAKNSILDTLNRVKSALQQNPGYKVVYEFPNDATASAAKKYLNTTQYKNTVTVRVRAE